MTATVHPEMISPNNWSFNEYLDNHPIIGNIPNQNSFDDFIAEHWLQQLALSWPNIPVSIIIY